jgi:1,4-alpha-glucan branching enzyme
MRPGRANKERLITVTFRFSAPQAREVRVGGSFSDWKLKPLQRRPDGSGVWEVSLRLKPGEYEYKYMVDGDWQLDPGQPCTAQNSFGTSNSVFRIGSDSSTIALAAS